MISYLGWEGREMEMQILCYLVILASRNHVHFLWALNLQLYDKGFVDSQIPSVTWPSHQKYVVPLKKMCE